MNQPNNWIWMWIRIWIWIWMLQISNNVHINVIFKLSKFEIWLQMVVKLCTTKPISYHLNLRFWDISICLLCCLCSMEFQFVILKVLVRVPLNGEIERVRVLGGVEDRMAFWLCWGGNIQMKFKIQIQAIWLFEMNNEWLKTFERN